MFLRVFFKKKFSYVFLGIIFILFVKTFIFDIKRINGNSMFPALKNGDCVFIFKAAYGIKIPGRNFYLIRWALPQLNDIIVYGKDGHFTVKRCSGISSSPIEKFTVYCTSALCNDGERKNRYAYRCAIP